MIDTRPPKPAGKTLLECGEVVCAAHLYADDVVDRALNIGDTYAADPCDRCPEKQND